MTLKTFVYTCLLFLGSLSMEACGSTKPGKNPETVEEAEAQLAKNRKKAEKDAKKVRKEAYKAHWDLQSKEARKSIKRNQKRHKKNNKKNRIVP